MNGTWDPQMQFVHINCLELLVVSPVLEHFLPFLRGHHVLVRTDNTTVVICITGYGRVHLCPDLLSMWDILTGIGISTTTSHIGFGSKTAGQHPLCWLVYLGCAEPLAPFGTLDRSHRGTWPLCGICQWCWKRCCILLLSR